MRELSMKKPHYGWIICLGCTLLLFTTMGLIANVFSVYRPYIIAQLGFSNTQCAMITTIRCMFSLISMCFIRSFYQKFNIRFGTGIAILISVLSFILFGLSKSIVGFYTAAAFAGIGYGLGTMFPISLIIDRWFARKKALALSICSIGSGIASIIFPSIITSIIENNSMQAAFFLQAGCMLALGVLIFFLLRNDPAQMQLAPYGLEQQEEEAKVLRPSSPPLSRKNWVLLGVFVILFNAVASSGDSNITLLFTTEGYSPMTVAFALSLFGLLLSVGKFLYGCITDRLGTYRSNYLFGISIILGQILCCFAFTQNTSVLFISMVLRGLGLPLSTVGFSMWALDFSDSRSYGVVLQRIQLFSRIGSLLFESFPGILADITGSYIPSYLCYAVFSVVSILGVQGIYLSRRKQAAESLV